MDIRYSASTIKIFKSCPFRFYCKITDQKQDTDTDMSYGDAGNVVHHTLEYFYKNLKNVEFVFALDELKKQFERMWDEAKLENPVLEKDTYWLCVINGIKLNVDPTDIEHEFRIEKDNINFIGYADVMNTQEHWIGDWKTSTYKKSKIDGYKDQLKYYSWAYFKEHNVIPVAWVFFNKANKLFKFKFTETDIKDVEQEIRDITKLAREKLKNLEFERRIGKTNCYFCPYKNICSSDLLRENASDLYEVIFHFKKNKLLVEGIIPDIIHRKIEKIINYEIKNASFIIQAMRAKGIKYDGIKRLYKRKEYGAETYIGYTHLIFDILKQYAQGEGKKIKLSVNDYRDQAVLENKITTPNKLNIPFDFYDFQNKAVTELLKYRWGIVEIGTGGGKTAIAAEVIRQLKLKTLFIIDNKDLLFQTKKEYEDMLGVKCSIVGTGKIDWSGDIVLATIQMLSKHVKTFANELEKIPLVIYDETHIIACKSFEDVSKYLINTKYRFGFSATAKRDDGNDNVIYAHTGQVIYRRRAQDLIKDGVLVDPEVIFFDYGAKLIVGDTWQNEYQNGIRDNERRNLMIKEISERYLKEGKQVMILTKMIAHGDWFKANIQGSDLIYGKTDDEIRVEILEDFKTGKLNLLIGNLKIFNKGINIKNLDVLINAAGNAGDVVTVQTIGRVLRKNPGKEKAYYIDFVDAGEYLRKHTLSRINALKNEDYNVSIQNYT